MQTKLDRFDSKKKALEYLQDQKGMKLSQAVRYLQDKVPKEQYYQTKIIEWIHENIKDAFVWKATQGAYSRKGIPDICMIKAGKFYGFEVKRPYFGKVSAMQELTQKQIKEAGGEYHIVTFVEEVEEILEREEIK